MAKVVDLVEIRRKEDKVYGLPYRLEGAGGMGKDGVRGNMDKKSAKSEQEIDGGSIGVAGDGVPMDRYTRQGWEKYLEREKAK